MAIKNRILDLAQSQAIQKVLQKFVELSSKAPDQTEGDDETVGASVLSGLVQDKELLDDLSKILPEALGKALSGWDDVTLDLIEATVEPDQPDLPIEASEIGSFIGSLPAKDLMKLRDAALELNDLSELVEMEKNSILGMFRQVFLSQESPSSNGTKSESNQSGGAPTSTS